MKSLLTKPLLLAGSLLISTYLPLSVTAADYPAPGDVAKGASVWAENCSRCHNARDPQDLRDDQWITTVFHMRARAGLTGQQSRDVLSFLQEVNTRVSPPSKMLVTNDLTSVSTMSGGDVYIQTCIACHGANGKGTVPGAPDFTRAGGRLSQSNEILFNHVKAGFQSPGSPMAMPPKGGNMNLTDADIRGVLDYLRRQFSR